MRLGEDVKVLIRHAVEDHNIDDETCYDLICSIVTTVGQTAYSAGRADQLEKVMRNMGIFADE